MKVKLRETIMNKGCWRWECKKAEKVLKCIYKNKGNEGKESNEGRQVESQEGGKETKVLKKEGNKERKSDRCSFEISLFITMCMK